MSPDARARTSHYPRLDNGSSTHGTSDMDPETRDAVMAMRGDWKFYATVSFCHTFRALLKLPKFTADQLESSLIDPTDEVVVIELLLRLLEDNKKEKRLAVNDQNGNDWETRLSAKLGEIAEESDYYEEEYPEKDGVRGHPLSDGRTFFDLAPSQRLDLIHVLCENKLTSSEACGEAMEALAAVAAPSAEYDGHPQCHGDAVGVDSENRIYYVSGDDLRVYRWEKPRGRGFADPGWGTVCAGLQEAKAFVAGFENTKSPKEKNLFEFFSERHLPRHIAAEEKQRRAERQLQAREEELERRRKAKDAYDSLDRKRSGRISIKLAEIAEERRIKAEAEEAVAAAEAAVIKREEDRQLACWRWMLLPPRLRPAEVPDGMDPSTSDAAVAAAARKRELDAAAAAEAAAAAAARAAETPEQRAARENPTGAAAVGRYLQVFWPEDDEWYDGLVEGYDAETGAHTVRYLMDDVAEEVVLARESKRWLEGRPQPAATSSELQPLPLPPPEPQEPGMEYRGVKVEGRSTTVLFAYMPKAESREGEEEENGDEEEEDKGGEEEGEPLAGRMRALADDMGADDDDDDADVAAAKKKPRMTLGAFEAEGKRDRGEAIADAPRKDDAMKEAAPAAVSAPAFVAPS